MSVFFENEFKNESENEIKNESENRCIMLPEEVKGKGYFALTGSKLKAYVEKWLDGIDEERDFGLFCGEETTVVTVPVGWFCVCFPWDAHEPVIGDENVILRKLVFKVFA